MEFLAAFFFFYMIKEERLMTPIEKNAIRMFGTPNRKETIDRIYRLASTTRDLDKRRQLFALCLKLDREDADKWYGCLYYLLSQDGKLCRGI